MHPSGESDREPLIPEQFGTADFESTLHGDESYDMSLLRPWSLNDKVSQKSYDPLPSSYDQNSVRDRGSGSFAPPELEQAYVNGGRLKFAKRHHGLWMHQMLVDRSLRIMAATMLLFASLMIILCLVNYNEGSKPMTDAPGSCSSMTIKSQVVHFFINVASTMVLGMSNTYQQLVTSLNVEDIPYALAKSGDARVGTNSPFSIKFKKNGKAVSWLIWILLISTSLPVHLLANSVVGPTLEFAPLEVKQYSATSYAELQTLNSRYRYSDSSCFIAFLSGYYPLANDLLSSRVPDFADLTITYDEQSCTSFKKANGFAEASQLVLDPGYGLGTTGNCSRYYSVKCDFATREEPRCGLRVRLEAAIILAVCLAFKAIYMVYVNFSWRRKIKSQCLTFGDVITACAIDPELRIRNECMVNAGDAYRQDVKHTCHKHCKEKQPSPSGDGLGHCQKCKKFNSINKAAQLPTPVLSTKYKRSLLSSLGSMSLLQMIILMLCSMAMLGISLTMAVFLASQWSAYVFNCSHLSNQGSSYECSLSLSSFISMNYGGFGGFNTSVPLTSLPPDSAGSEMVSFWIANGAQLIFSLLYLLLIYNITLISMEHDWGSLEKAPRQLRCTLVESPSFIQSYFLQLPKRVMLPAMIVSALMHWLLGQSISATETFWQDTPDLGTRHFIYTVEYAVCPVWISTILMMGMTGMCWWAFTYTREGFIPQMYGSIRACCAAASELDDLGDGRLKWGDLGMGEKFRHAGLSSGPVGPIVPAELYAGRSSKEHRD